MTQEYPVTISVLMAVYNTPFEFVVRAVESVLSQDFQHFELIIIDDGSNASLGNKLLTYSQKISGRVRYLRHENCGQSRSINRGVRVSRGAFIAIIDADDEYKPNHLLSCFSEMRFADLTYSLTETIVDSHHDYYVPDKDDNRKSIHVDECVLFATLFGKKEVFKQLPFKDMYAADHDFYAQAALLFVVKKLSQRTYVYYRNIANSITAKLKEEQFLLTQKAVCSPA